MHSMGSLEEPFQQLKFKQQRDIVCWGSMYIGQGDGHPSR